MGNICRSPTAEGFFRFHLEQSGLSRRVKTDSAGTHSYHLGSPPDPRAVEEAARFGVDISQLRARKVTAGDFERFDHVVAMDRSNLENLRRLAGQGSAARLDLMLDYAPGAGLDEVPDPYYGSRHGFTEMCTLLDRATKGLLQSLEARLSGAV